ncbi:hypothetical protein [Polyangium aurulentum]|uniref:hypothetical protein n=1 Tax=Polyangium aurulentum TaxID=2567896 RepID=UPI00146D3F08|nr:hypothetical protein [Polyangium aurulentum]UQA58351.1 hypothetical protein E8A73_045085 [Polyangium aurulentum]
MKHPARFLISLALASGLGLGCGKGGEAPAPAGSASAAAPAAAGKGIDAPGNDPAVVALARKALGCKWGPYGLEATCADLRALLEDPALRDSKADATFMNLLEDPSEQVRWLGARALSTRGTAYRADKALAERAVKAAEDEKSKTVGQELGGVVGNIKHAETGLGERIKAMAKTHPLQAVRMSLLSRMLFTNGELLYDFVKDIAQNDADPMVRKAALSAFWTGTPPNKAADTCAMWLSFIDDKVEDVAGEAAYLTAFYPQGGGCKEQWDPLLDKIEKRAKEGTIKSSQMASALLFLHRQPGASEAQKKRSLVAARALLEKKENSGMARGKALEFIVEKDLDGRKFIEKFREDPDFFVKSRAKDLAAKTGGDKAKAEPADDKPKAEPAGDKAKAGAPRK